MRRNFWSGLLAGSLLGMTLLASVANRREGRKLMREGTKARKKLMRLYDDLTDLWK
ncbi:MULTISPECIES: hypothetical protein [Carboxydothermus]|uniref:Uncharacterized protein n=2 Tax=Carboxydothermus TaxID=129957 RepID=Q3AEP0_CARHZ|nr:MULTISPECIES: hypothetical protein [Carboxydothermus]ABB16187.1 hypothetical protein CHY_0536 [Carboxydothermus hydrogenoformans Z-2901]NYE56417.1 hypothetical protein [Carboxydothermus ferrireducens DSM 11255]